MNLEIYFQITFLKEKLFFGGVFECVFMFAVICVYFVLGPSITVDAL